MRGSGLSAALGAVILTIAASSPRPSHAQGQGQGCDVRGFSSSMAFGTYDPFSTIPTDVRGTIRYRCPRNWTIQILLDGGTSASFAPRFMRSGAERLGYNLYFDAACTQVWGDGSPGAPGYTATAASGGNVTLTVYGRVFPGQDVAAGAYSDVVTMTVLF